MNYQETFYIIEADWVYHSQLNAVFFFSLSLHLQVEGGGLKEKAGQI